jgi:hypothetical protein
MGSSGSRRCRLGGQKATEVGGPVVLSHSRFHADAQGQKVGRCKSRRRERDGAWQAWAMWLQVRRGEPYRHVVAVPAESVRAVE